MGSPPRVRGKALVFERERTEHRITPACAGKRPRPRRWVRPPRDHPRVCGEKTEEQKERAEYLGSPLRVRGKGVDALGGCLSAGITPAYAGKSAGTPPPDQHKKDHPRVCGEKKPAPSGLDSQQGSPPRVRGKVQPAGSLHTLVGITPAYAGKSLSVPTHGSRPGDHPRVCGEKGLDGAPAGSGLGSPPRVRGKDPRWEDGTCPCGITPACAGKSCASLR